MVFSKNSERGNSFASVLCACFSILSGDLLYDLWYFTDVLSLSAVGGGDTSRGYLVTNALSVDKLRDDRLRAAFL